MSPTPTQRSDSSLQASVQVLAQQMLDLKARQEEDREVNEQRFVTKDAFSPVQKLVYGMTTIALTSLVAAIVALVLRK